MADAKVAEQVMQARVDRYADSREQDLGADFYSVETRSLAAMLASDWVAIADQYDVTLDDLDGCTSVAIAALDAIQASRRRLSR